ncbi:MAG TPA: TSUP family transporter [Myxococcaceae bacterium]|jgi:hypothetical protein
MELAGWQVAVLAVVALVAGTVDAIAGGGGLLTLPALLAFGVPPQLALGTNKGQSVFGSFTSMVRFLRLGVLDARRARWALPLGLAGSAAGAALLLALDPGVLRPVVLGLLVGAAAVVALRPRVPDRKGEAPMPVTRGRWVAAGAASFGIAMYDGFFGPGTGTFLIVAFALLLGDSLVQASASAKLVNFASNLAAVTLFAARGTVLWKVALPMAMGQLAGGYLGAHLTVRGGEKVVRRAVLLVVAALMVKLSRDLWLSR